MLTLSPDVIYPYINQIFWPFLRLLALFSTAPVFNEAVVDRKVKIGLTLAVTFLMLPSLPESHIMIFSLDGVLTGLRQVLIGLAVGLAMQMIFVAVRHSGEIIGLQMGLSFATFYDPGGKQNMPVVARLLNTLVTLLFLVFNGHRYLIEVMAESFIVLPVSAEPSGAGSLMAVVQSAGLIFKCGMMLGLPVVALLLCLNMTLGLLNRLTPQLSIFVIGFPISLGVGMLALSLIMYILAPFFEQQMAGSFDFLSQMLAGFR